jgi:SAM-dependent methyltransferase
MTDAALLARTRTAYDTVAVTYEALLRDALAASPDDRAVLALFAERVRLSGGGSVGDLGCGPGRITSHLHDLGLDVFGVDLSPAMVAVARRAHPRLPFEVGSLRALPVRDDALAGAVAWYSVIHTPPERLPDVVGELVRVVRPGGWLVLAFQAGDGEWRKIAGYGHDVDLEAWWHSPSYVESLLAEAGAPVQVRVVREPEGVETTRQAYLLATVATT